MTLQEELRWYAECNSELTACLVAADRLDVLEAKNTRLRDALKDAIGWIGGISISGARGQLSRPQVIRRELLQRLRRTFGGQ